MKFLFLGQKGRIAATKEAPKHRRRGAVGVNARRGEEAKGLGIANA